MNPGTSHALAVATMLQRALNLVDARLVDHGLRVAAIVDAMLEVDGTLSAEDRRDAFFLTLFHDIGAYRTEEINRMVSFETESVWEHSVYGYLFLRELSPLARLSEAVLYHHAPCARLEGVDPAIARIAQVLHVADRVDVFFLEHPDGEKASLLAYLEQARGDALAPEALDLFCEADRTLDPLGRIAQGLDVEQFLHAYPVSDSDAGAFFDMLVHSIDFRSRHTVAHTMTTAQVAVSMAKRLGATDDEVRAIRNGAIVHDLGKIGIPLEILEKPGALTPDEAVVMRTHVALTEHIIAGCVDPAIARIALRHHEKLDGSGYPLGLSASDLTGPERIVAVADIVSALSGTRSYKEAYGKDKVIAIIGDLAAQGLIDRRSVEVLARDYDAVMEEVRYVCAPIMAAYERMQEEYGTLLATLAR